MINYLFPEGRSLALTFSYDDGNNADKKLLDILTDHKMKGTFNLNASTLHNPGKIQADEIKPLIIDRGHEVACHGFTHPFEEKLPPQAMIEDIRLDKLALEEAVGAPVRGMAYPFGTYNEQVKMLLQALGIVYSRTTGNAGTAYMPTDFLEWHATTHHNGKNGTSIRQMGETLLKTPGWYGTHMLYVWGHAYEFENAKNWHIIEDFCDLMAGHEDKIWYATNIEIYDYIQAFRRLYFSADLKMVQNPSVIPVWIKDRNGKVFVAEPGKITKLD